MFNLVTGSEPVGTTLGVTSDSVYELRSRSYNEIKVDVIISELVCKKRFNEYVGEVEKKLEKEPDRFINLSKKYGADLK